MAGGEAVIGNSVGVTVSFYGVRGSTPCSSSAMTRYGGNTSCVVVQRHGERPLVLDAGTGLRFYGLDMGDAHFQGSILLTHLHWDHVQGLPFFPQALHDDSEVLIYGPPEQDRSFGTALSDFVQPPYFPISLTALPGHMEIRDIWSESVEIDTAIVTARSVPHQGRTNGYRIEWPDFSMAYIPDHQQPADPTHVADSVLDLVRDVDLVIHDAQFTDELLAKRLDWGHCTPDYAVHVAESAGASKLALFHHDPLHDDESLDVIFEQVQERADTVEILAAAEGMKLSF